MSLDRKVPRDCSTAVGEEVLPKVEATGEAEGPRSAIPVAVDWNEAAIKAQVAGETVAELSRRSPDLINLPPDTDGSRNEFEREAPVF